MSDSQGTGIVGNQSSIKTAATSTREEKKKSWQGTPAKITIGAALLIVAVSLASSGLTLWEKLLTALIVWFAASKVENAKKNTDYRDVIWIWPTIAKGTISLMLLVAFLNSGLGLLAKDGIEKADATTTCWVDDTQQKCIDLKNEQKLEEAQEHTERLLKAQRQAELQVAIEAAREAAKPVPTIAKRVETCGGRYKVLSDCVSVVFGKNEKWDFAAKWDPVKKKGSCPVYDPPDAGILTKLAKNQYTFVPHHSGVRVRFYNIPAGVTFYGQTC